MGAYASSKAAVIKLTQTAALELRPLGIRVNCVLPGMIGMPRLEQIRA
jgi:NAD(P)-dependent dehydrogenase (short-subunit alcohol dehydrogenase family)